MLKEKLDSLKNYDDSELTSKINTIEETMETLFNGDASSAIESFNEIVAFLEGIEDSESLDNIIASIETQLADKAEKTDIPTVTNILKSVYPIGAIYISTVSTSPATLFGFGTWERIKDTFLLGAGSTYAAGSTGGEEEHTLTINEMPNHTHAASLKTAPNATTNNIYKFNLIRDMASESTGRSLVAKGSDYYVAAANPKATDYGGDFDISSSPETAPAGEGQPHNNMPPYLTVYMWKRVN